MSNALRAPRDGGEVRCPRGGLACQSRAAEATSAAAKGQRNSAAGVSKGVASAALAVRAVHPDRDDLWLP